MKRALVSCLVFLLACGDSAFAQQPSTAPASPAATSPTAAAPNSAPPPNTLMDGTAVKLRLAETVSSADAKAGQQVPFEVTEDVVVQGVTVIPKGTQALATVTEAQPKRRMGRGGKLNVNVDGTRLIDGEKVQLRAVRDNNGGGHVGAMTGAIVATSIVFFPAAPFFLFMKGKDITIPKGTEVTSFVQGDMRLDMDKLAAVAAGAPAGTPTPPVSVQMASLTVDSSVAGADIEVDGTFMGNTPSTVSVTPGQHTVLVKKKGFSDWSRTMNVSGSAVHLSADLSQTASPAQ